LVTGKAFDMLKELNEQDPEKYVQFWETYGAFLKEGVAVEQDQPERLFSLLRFHTSRDLRGWSSLADIVERADSEQEEIYYFLGDDPGAVRFSPHMDSFRKKEIEVLVLTDPVDSFMLMRLKEYEGHPLVNVADAELPEVQKSSEKEDELDQAVVSDLVTRFKTLLGDRVGDVRTTDRLLDSPARLVDPEGAPDQSMQRVYQMMDKKFELPKKILELNPRHTIMKRLASLPEGDPKFALAAEQIYENTLLIEGLHPDPVSMVGRIQDLIASALGEETGSAD
jgi:molecular chaperone HtpG